MVASLGPSRFYGSGLPRPRFYNSNNGEDRVNPPVSILDPLLSWAEEAHWSMGGLSSKRHRLQGRIEGSIQKLRMQEESREKKKRKIERSDLVKKAKKAKRENSEKMKKLRDMEEEADIEESEEEDLVLESDSNDDVEEEEEEENVSLSVISVAPVKTVTPLRPRRRARNLVDEFDKIAASEKSYLVVKPSSPVPSKNKKSLSISNSSPAGRFTSRSKFQISSPRRSPRFFQMCCSESI